MENLFNFNYIETPLKNLDGSDSNFRQVFGLNGINMVCPKGTYHIVKTEDLSSLGHAFINKGYGVSTFEHRSGESIGLNINIGKKPTKVGECTYNLIITVPNNGGGKGYLSIKQTRLICLNGAISDKTMHKDNYIKIPHTIDYKESINLMERSIESFVALMTQLENRDEVLSGIELKDTDVLFQLNKWFFEQEMPVNQKGDMTFNQFRELLVIAPEDIKSIARYDELKEAYVRELAHNAELELPLSMYTVYATVTNYLSRRVEKSGSRASDEVKLERVSSKLVFFENI